MDKKFQEYKGLDLSQVNKDVLKEWESNNTFEQSLKNREGYPSFVFFEGPPSANGMPGIHHVMARTIKDIICRYKTLQGFLVERKAGWDTHGLPVELGVEKKLGITKENIGKTISVADYNKECRSDVMKFTREWEDLTNKMGYWVDMSNPYITYDNRYIETLWYLLKQLYEKGFLYKGYTIQPYSPAAGTGLSTHELNQPGCYRDVKDTTCVAQFKVIRDEKSEKLFAFSDEVYFTAWTTTPWTLPSNTALAVGPNITYLEVKTYNPYTFRPVTIIMAKDRFSAYFNKKAEGITLEDYKEGDKLIPYQIVAEYKGPELEGIRYEQLLPWMQPMGDAFRVILGDYVTTEDGTGIVHIAPTFGADDDRVAKVAGIAPLQLIDKEGSKQPMVDKRGRLFRMEDIDPEYLKNNVNTDLYGEFAGRFVKNAYDPNLTENDTTLDIDLSILLKRENKAFKVEKHEHNYPHCWRTDKPVLYYPLDSWFIKTTAVRDRMIELNKTINWKPASTGEGRFGKWLENLVDWNLSRSRYWGTPLPIWVSEDGTEKKCIGSVKELVEETEKAIQAGIMKENPFKDFKVGDYSKENYEKIDLHRPYVDDIILVSPTGQPMYREKDLIDVWFDSGAMPYAQLHYPFENGGEHFKTVYPADFIAEGVDQTRGWFYTLEAISTLLFDRAPFENCIVLGHVQDEQGRKMSKHLGNVVSPFDELNKFGADALRWYFYTTSAPWLPSRYSEKAVREGQNKFLATLQNVYAFFAMYADIDNFDPTAHDLKNEQLSLMDKWILSKLNTLIKRVDDDLWNYRVTEPALAIQDFVDELSNWYVRRGRERFWGKGDVKDKDAAFTTLYHVLVTVSQVCAPFIPFLSEEIYQNLVVNNVPGAPESVHRCDFPTADESAIDADMEAQMDALVEVVQLGRACRNLANIKTRQTAAKLYVKGASFSESYQALCEDELNVKEVVFTESAREFTTYQLKPQMRTLGPKYGKLLGKIGQHLQTMDGNDVVDAFERGETVSFDIDGTLVTLGKDDVLTSPMQKSGFVAQEDKGVTVVLDTNLTPELIAEGYVREVVSKVQTMRKESDFDVTDRVDVRYECGDVLASAIESGVDMLKRGTLAEVVERAPMDDTFIVRDWSINGQDCKLGVRVHKA